MYLSGLEFISSGSTVIISSNGHRLVVDPPNLLIRSSTGRCQEDICRVKSARARQSCKVIEVIRNNYDNWERSFYVGPLVVVVAPDIGLALKYAKIKKRGKKILQYFDIFTSKE